MVLLQGKQLRSKHRADGDPNGLHNSEQSKQREHLCQVITCQPEPEALISPVTITCNAHAMDPDLNCKKNDGVAGVNAKTNGSAYSNCYSRRVAPSAFRNVVVLSCCAKFAYAVFAVIRSNSAAVLTKQPPHQPTGGGPLQGLPYLQ